VLVVNASSPYRSLQDVIAAAKAKPDALAFGSSGNGTSQHLSGELAKSMAGINMLHVPYKGSAPAMQALLGNELTMVFQNIVAAVPLVQSSKLRRQPAGYADGG
jgi:tripartite-type tricarboxylate transporter receptor subunit TctC